MPSMKKYLERRTIFTEEKIPYNEEDSPELVVHSVPYYTTLPNCVNENRNSYKKAVKCINDSVKSKEVLLPSENHSKVKWLSTFGPFWRGVAYVRRIKMNSNSYYTLKLPDDGFTIEIDIYDPKIYLPTEKVMTIPRLLLLLKPNKTSLVNLKVDEIEILKKPNQNCIPDTNYSFTDCLQVRILLILVHKYIFYLLRNSFWSMLVVTTHGKNGWDQKLKDLGQELYPATQLKISPTLTKLVWSYHT